jgi:hypothetical protein
MKPSEALEAIRRADATLPSTCTEDQLRAHLRRIATLAMQGLGVGPKRNESST